MADYAVQGRKAELEQKQAAALVKLDRELQALENFGKKRVLEDLTQVAETIDLFELQSILADLILAKREYDAVKLQLKRL